MYRIKEKPEDFIVNERIKLNLKNNGDYGYYLLTKKRRDTLDAVQEVARFFNVNVSDVGIAGNKDKVAITTQYISVKHGIEKGFSYEDLSLEFVGHGDKPISLGDLEGNVFEIIVRGVEQKRKVAFIENYYDEQRFGKYNKEVGKCLVVKDFTKACFILGLEGDGVNSLRSLGKKMLSFYLHSYQSYLWNELAAMYIREKSHNYREISYSEGKFVFCDNKLKNIGIPIINFNSSFKDKLLAELLSKLLEREGVSQDQFLIRELPELASLPLKRRLYVDVEWNRVEFFKDIAKLKFFLNKGSYATIVVKKMFA